MPDTQEITLNPLAAEANEAIAKDCPAVFNLLSERGRRFFFPTKGILAQGAQAKQKAKVANATIGIAVENGEPMFLPCVDRHFAGLSAAEIYDYAPSYGIPELRQAWAGKQREETPSMGGHLVSNPVVTQALTHGLSVVGELFLDPGDEALSSDLMWENYNLAWETRIGAHISTYPFFNPQLTGFNPAWKRPWTSAKGTNYWFRLTSPTTLRATRPPGPRRWPSSTCSPGPPRLAPGWWWCATMLTTACSSTRTANGNPCSAGCARPTPTSWR